MRTKLLVFALLLIPGTALAQRTPCHAYVVNVEAGEKLMQKIRMEGQTPENLKALGKAQTVFPEFQPDYSEERLTTKTFPFPESKLIITVSVITTDESMPSFRDSLLLGIVTGPNGLPDALKAENNAVAEVMLDNNTDTARVKQYLKVNGKLFLMGLECHIKEQKPKTSQ